VQENPETILRENTHPNYKDGSQTLETKKYRASEARLRGLEQLMVDTGMFDEHFKRTVGWKPRHSSRWSVDHREALRHQCWVQTVKHLGR
jgi:hypothetical protein